jgi:uncharacterized membrane protein
MEVMINRLTTQQIISNGLIAGLYVILTILPPLDQISYLAIQFRVSEALLLLIFFRKDYVFGIVIGTFLANLLGPTSFGLLDAFLGSLVTLIVGILMGKSKSIYFAFIFPVVLNGIYLGLFLPIMIPDLPFEFFVILTTGFFVALGEAGVLYLIALPLYLTLRKNRYFLVLIGATQNVR